MLVIHGDKFDKVIRFNKVLTFIGDICYNLTVSMNVKINQVKYYFGYKNNSNAEVKLSLSCNHGGPSMCNK